MEEGGRWREEGGGEREEERDVRTTVPEHGFVLNPPVLNPLLPLFRSQFVLLKHPDSREITQTFIRSIN